MLWKELKERCTKRGSRFESLPKVKTHSEKIATYPEFGHEATELTKYIEAVGTFSILLRDGDIVHYKPNNIEDFREWLAQHDVPNLRDW